MKLLGIILYPESKLVCRILQKRWFPFEDYPKPSGNNIVNIPHYPDEIENIYTNPNGPNISINAIVWKNGAGKLSILDILFKIISVQ